MLLAIAGCGGGSASSSSSTPSGSTGLFGATVETLSTAGDSGTWVVWNKQTCSYQPAPTKPSGQYVPVVRKPTSPMVLGHQEQSEDNSINLLKNASVKSAAQEAGFTLAEVNGKYPDQASMVSAAETIAGQSPFAVIEDQPLATLAPRLNGIYAAKCIPYLQFSLMTPGVITFGASNAVVGQSEGTALESFVKDKGWAAADLTVVGSVIPSLGPINDRVTGCASVIQKAFSGATVSNLSLASGTVADTQTSMTNWLTSHPNAKHVLGCTISGLQAVGMDNALTAANRQSDGAITSTGQTQKDLSALPSGSAIIGTIDFGNDKFGHFALAMLESVANGDPVPNFVYTPTKFLKR